LWHLLALPALDFAIGASDWVLVAASCWSSLSLSASLSDDAGTAGISSKLSSSFSASLFFHYHSYEAIHFLGCQVLADVAFHVGVANFGGVFFFWECWPYYVMQISD
jgi:hypothetical protein